VFILLNLCYLCSKKIQNTDYTRFYRCSLFYLCLSCQICVIRVPKKFRTQITRDFTDFHCFFLFILLNICYFCSKILRTHKIPYLQIHCNRFRYATKIKKNRPESSEIRIYFRNFNKKIPRRLHTSGFLEM
jgi:hypothetical protein